MKQKVQDAFLDDLYFYKEKILLLSDRLSELYEAMKFQEYNDEGKKGELLRIIDDIKWAVSAYNKDARCIQNMAEQAEYIIKEGEQNGN